MAKTKTKLEQAAGANRLIINQDTNSSQMLVKLCRNGSDWLSPVGWSPDEKGTLLDCRSGDGRTELDIPEQFAADLKAGDSLQVQCPELALTQDIKWHAVTEAKPADAAPVIEAANGNLLSRFKRSKKAEPAFVETRSDTEMRAEEAERVAASYKAKMDVAANAKIEAERKAYETAKAAELALEQEMKRIGEMERAAKAYEEAEQLKQDELMRLADERRIEEERLAEEARRIEAARQREIAAHKAAERQAAVKRYQEALEITAEQKGQLSEQLGGLEKDAISAKKHTKELNANLEGLRGKQEKVQTKTTRMEAKLTKSMTALKAAEAELELARKISENTKAENVTLEQSYTDAEREYLEAQRIADEAIALANAKQARLEEVGSQKSDILTRLTTASDTLETRTEAFGHEKTSTQKVRMDHEKLALELSGLEQTAQSLSEQTHIARDTQQTLEIQAETTRQAIEDLDALEADHLSAIKALEAGADVDDLNAPRPIEIKTAAPKRAAALKQTSAPSLHKAEKPAKSKFRDRVKVSAFKKPKVTAPAVKVSELPIKQGAALLVVAALIGAGTFAVASLADAPKPATLRANMDTPKPSKIATSQPEPVKLASVTTGTKLPEAAVIKAAVIEVPVVESPAIKVPFMEAPAIQIPALETPIIDAPKVEAALDTKPEIVPPSVPEKVATVYKTSDVNFEDLQQGEIYQRPVLKAELKTPVSSSPVKTAKAKIAPKPRARASKYESEAYVAVIEGVQAQLMTLGMYNGPIDGKYSADTIAAIGSYKELLGQKANGEITGNFLRELQKTETVQAEQTVTDNFVQPASEIAEVYIEPMPVKTAELTPVSYNSYVPAEPIPAPSSPVYTDTLAPAEMTPSAVIESAPVITEPVVQPEPVKVASAPIEVPAVQVTAAKLRKRAKTPYPGLALRREVYVNAEVNVGYDVDVNGKTTNVRVIDSSYSGKLADSFSRSAVKAIEDYRFEPRFENGVATVSKGHQTKITYRIE